MSDTTEIESQLAVAADAVASGKFLLRLEPGLHAALREAARSAGVSLNEYCSRKLAAPVMNPVEPGATLVERAASMFGAGLVGVVAYGSWARGELTDRSDFDALIIVTAGTALNRQLYRTWDDAPLVWNALSIEPHFTRLPEPGAPVAGFWTEVAIDGIVLFEREYAVSRKLVEIRRRLAGGEFVRHSVHGQPYWIGGNRDAEP